MAKFFGKLFSRKPKGKAGLEAFALQYETILAATLATLDHGIEASIGAQLQPIYFDEARESRRHLLVPAQWRPVDSRLRSLEQQQRQTARAGAWTSLQEVTAIQPGIAVAIARLIHDFAAGHALVSDSSRARPLPVGPASILFLLALNNVLRLQNLVLSYAEVIAYSIWEREQYHAKRSRLENAIATCFTKIANVKWAPRSGDLLFFYISAQALEDYSSQAKSEKRARKLEDLKLVLSSLSKLIALSPFSLVMNLDNEALWWKNISPAMLDSIELLLEDSCAYDFLGPMVQHWVEALTSAKDERILQRIEAVLRYLAPEIVSLDNAISLSPRLSKAKAGQTCLARFVRVLLRTWPDSDDFAREMATAARERQMLWHKTFTRVQEWVISCDLVLGGPVAEHAGQQRLTIAERAKLERLIAIAQRAMPKPASQVTAPAPSIPAQPMVNENDLFPLYGVSLGRTTVEELARSGTRATSINSKTGEPHRYYEINGLNFWYNDDGIANFISIHRSLSIPAPWRALGFDLNLSYNEWMALLKRLGYDVKITQSPKVVFRNGRAFFDAEIDANKQTKIPIGIMLYFGYSTGTTADSKGTLYSLSVTRL